MRNWREYLMEAGNLGLFMMSACGFGTLLGHPSSPVVAALPDEFARRALMGAAMGLTAVSIIRSPWGMRSGAHMNPATTLTFLSLGKIRPADAIGYVAGQFAGGIAGVLAAFAVLGPLLADPGVNFVVTRPGSAGAGAAFAAEAAITFLLMSAVLHVSNSARFTRFTPYVAGAMVALYITVEAPISGMSMNPARTLGSAVWAGSYESLWIYFAAPPLGMLAAAAFYRVLPGVRRVYCAKLHHHGNATRCIFNCQFGEIS